MARRKIRNIVNLTPGTSLDALTDLFGAGIVIPGGNLLRIAITPRTATKLSTTATFGVGNRGDVKEGVDLVAGADTIFESVISGKLFNAQVTVATIVDKFIVEAYLDY